jgi:C_GCAxxG_C_C family probable redox protein
MTKVEHANSYFEKGFSCSQAVLAAYALELGMEEDVALRVSQAFGGGIARMGETCGAVSGALMAIGLKYGRKSAEGVEAKEHTYDLGAQFIEAFKRRNGSVICRELVGYDVSKPEELERARAEGIFDTVCFKLVRDATEIVEQIL